MPEKTFDPLSVEFSETLAALEPDISPEQLLEIVTEQVKTQLPSHLDDSTSVKAKARQRVLSFMIGLEYKSRGDLDRHIANAVSEKLKGRWEHQDPELLRSIERGEAMRKKYEGFVDENSQDEVLVADIDRPVAPGEMTMIHVAAMDGEVEEVKRLVAAGARLDIKDKQGWYPEDRAKATGHKSLAEWLKVRRLQATGNQPA